jgi:hypothetical protein
MKEREMSDYVFKHKTYRIEWRNEVWEIDQYGKETKIISSKPFATPEEALKDLESISKPHSYISGRRVANRDVCKHEYHDCDVRYYETLWNEYIV